jgi:hypothetical protein
MSNLSLPPVPPGSGKKKYGVVAILFGIGVVAIAWWTRQGNAVTVAPPPPPQIAQTTQPSNPKLEDIPPPLPPEEKPEAGPTGGPRIVYVRAPGCDGKCGGTYPPDLEQAIKARAAQARRCYNSALSQDSSLKGHVTLSVRIGPSGNVCSAAVASNDMGSPAVANCAANIFRASEGFPSPRGGCVDATVPFSFVPLAGH